MKKIILISVVFCTIILASCNQADMESNILLVDRSVLIDELLSNVPKPFDTIDEGNAFVFYNPFVWKFTNIEDEFISYVGEKKYIDWMNSFAVHDGSVCGLFENANLYSFIVKFDISNDVIIDILTEKIDPTIKGNNGWIYTAADIDILCSRDEKMIMERFVSTAAIFIGTKIYSLQWVYTHTVDDYISENLSAEQICTSVASVIYELPFTDEADAFLIEKVDTYVEMQKVPGSMPAPFGNLEYRDADTKLLFYETLGLEMDSLSSSFSSLVEEDDFEEWRVNINNAEDTEIRTRFGVYPFIVYFDIPDETARKILVNEMGYNNESKVFGIDYLTEEEIDLILSKDDAAIVEHFIVPSAIAKGSKVYSPKWIYLHSIEDYIREGITAEEISIAVSNFINKLPFVPKARTALENKVSEYKLYEEQLQSDNLGL